jgi:hypothetical protein
MRDELSMCDELYLCDDLCIGAELFQIVLPYLKIGFRPPYTGFKVWCFTVFAIPRDALMCSLPSIILNVTIIQI